MLDKRMGKLLKSRLNSSTVISLSARVRSTDNVFKIFIISMMFIVRCHVKASQNFRFYLITWLKRKEVIIYFISYVYVHLICYLKE